MKEATKHHALKKAKRLLSRDFQSEEEKSQEEYFQIWDSVGPRKSEGAMTVTMRPHSAQENFSVNKVIYSWNRSQEVQECSGPQGGS